MAMVQNVSTLHSSVFDSVCDDRTWTQVRDCFPQCEIHNQADIEEQRQGETGDPGQERGKSCSLGGVLALTSQDTVLEDPGVLWIWRAFWLPCSFSLHFLSLTRVKILCFAFKTITSCSQKEKSEGMSWFVQEIMKCSFYAFSPAFKWAAYASLFPQRTRNRLPSISSSAAMKLLGF